MNINNQPNIKKMFEMKNKINQNMKNLKNDIVRINDNNKISKNRNTLQLSNNKNKEIKKTNNNYNTKKKIDDCINSIEPRSLRTLFSPYG